MRTTVKQTIVRHGAAMIWPSRIIARMVNATEIPRGYQDASGFHLGTEPVVTEGLSPFLRDNPGGPASFFFLAGSMIQNDEATP